MAIPMTATKMTEALLNKVISVSACFSQPNVTLRTYQLKPSAVTGVDVGQNAQKKP